MSGNCSLCGKPLVSPKSAEFRLLEALEGVVTDCAALKEEMVRLSEAKDRSASHTRAETARRAREISERASAAIAKARGETK